MILKQVINGIEDKKEKKKVQQIVAEKKTTKCFFVSLGRRQSVAAIR